MTTPTDVPAGTESQERVRQLRDLVTDPVMSLMLAPGSVRVTFPYGGSNLVLLAQSPEALARVGRIMRVIRSRRYGRSGNRRWENALRHPDQMLKPAVPIKTR